VTNTSHCLSANELSSFLKIIGLARHDGELYSNQRDKFQEVLAMAEHLTRMSLKITKKRSVTFLDCACGKGYTAFALNHILTENLRRSAFFVGVDRNPRLIEKCREAQRLLGYSNMEFEAADIMHLSLNRKPDVVYCLHACDTATDEAIAKGIMFGSRFIVAVPCCQREMGTKMCNHPLTSMTQFPALKERLTSLVTDAMRTLILKAAGYKVSVFEFVSSEVTPKNLMLRAEKLWTCNTDALVEYRQLRALFNVEPKIEEHLPWLRS